MTTNADELVRRLILRTFQARPGPRVSHLSTCEAVEVVDEEASDGMYGCDTGCEYVRFEATLRCPHGESERFEWGDFGQLSYMIDSMTRSLD